MFYDLVTNTNSPSNVLNMEDYSILIIIMLLKSEEGFDSGKKCIGYLYKILCKWTWCNIEIVMNELRRFKHSAYFHANSSHIIESATISAS